VRRNSVWAELLGVQDAVVEDIEYDEEAGHLVVGVRVRSKGRRRCGHCGRRSPKEDAGDGRRTWRTLDLGTVPAFIEAEAPRVNCREHGVVVAAVPWARHASRYTKNFEDQAAWLATQTSKSAISELLRVTWRSVGRIITRVVAEGRKREDALDGLKRIGIDEVSHRKGQKYLTVVYDHDRKRVVWVAAGRSSEVVRRFFDELGPERSAALQQVSADGAGWIRNVVRQRCPQAHLTLDPFHVVAWATEALDEVRRDVWNDARRAGQTALAEELKGARFAVWKNPENLTDKQKLRLALIAKTNHRLYRAYLLKEQLRQVFQAESKEQGIAILMAWLRWASRSRITAFVKLAKNIRKHVADIAVTLELGLTNAALESANTRIRLMIRRAFGFHSPEATIALVLLSLGGLCPPLPGR
jgi:transposase